MEETSSTPSSFNSLFQHHREIVLESPEHSPLADLSHVVVSDDKIFIADRIQSDVKVYTFDGRLLRIIGGPGDGPGELRGPHLIALTGAEVAVMGSGGRLSWFDSLGIEIQIGRFQGHHASSLVWDEQSRQLLVAARGAASETRPYFIHRISRDGEILESFWRKPVRTRPYEGEVSKVHMVQWDDSLVSLRESSNEIRFLDLRTHEISTAEVASPNYDPPEWPKQAFGDVNEFLRWSNDQTWVHGVWNIAPGAVLVGFRRFRPQGEMPEMSYAIVSGAGVTRAITGSTQRVVVAARGGKLYTAEMDSVGVFRLVEHVYVEPPAKGAS